MNVAIILGLVAGVPVGAFLLWAFSRGQRYRDAGRLVWGGDEVGWLVADPESESGSSSTDSGRPVAVHGDGAVTVGHD